MPEPAIRQFVIKVHSRCNLACDYCYVYAAVDQSGRGQPRSIAPGTVRATGRRIAEHAEHHQPPRQASHHEAEASYREADAREHGVDLLA